MSRVYYPVRYRLDNTEHYLIWHSAVDGEGDEADGVVHRAGRVLAFRTLPVLLAYARAEGLSPVQDNAPAFYNLDAVAGWLRRKRSARLDCVLFLNAWNLLADISASVGGDFDPDRDRTRRVYDKLFWGNNLPAVTPVGKHYEPLWSGREARIIRQVLGEGLVLFRRHVRAEAAPAAV